MNNKTHAKDYLSEFSNDKPDWFKTLIKDAIETNGSIEEFRINEIFDNLLNGTPLQVQAYNLSSAQQSSQKLLFESLTHVSGVNALCENQTIKFSPDVTVLYGLNGSGKSGRSQQRPYSEEHQQVQGGCAELHGHEDARADAFMV